MRRKATTPRIVARLRKPISKVTGSGTETTMVPLPTHELYVPGALNAPVENRKNPLPPIESKKVSVDGIGVKIAASRPVLQFVQELNCPEAKVVPGN